MKSARDIAPVQEQRFGVLHLSSVSLLVPLSEIHSLESVLDMDPRSAFRGSVGAVHSAGTRFPVFCLSDNLEAVAELPETFRVCAILSAGDVAFALACRAVSSLDRAAIDHHPLPDCMRTNRSPVRALAYDGQRILCHTSLAELAPIIEAAA